LSNLAASGATHNHAGKAQCKALSQRKKRSAHQQRVNQFPPVFRATAHDHAVRLQYFYQRDLLGSQALLLHRVRSFTLVQQRHKASALLCWNRSKQSGAHQPGANDRAFPPRHLLFLLVAGLTCCLQSLTLVDAHSAKAVHTACQGAPGVSPVSPSALLPAEWMKPCVLATWVCSCCLVCLPCTLTPGVQYPLY